MIYVDHHSHLLHGQPQVEYFGVPLEHVVRGDDAHEVHALLLPAIQALHHQSLLPQVPLEDPPLAGGLRRRGNLVAAVPRQHEVDGIIVVAAFDMVVGVVQVLKCQIEMKITTTG